MLFQSPTCEDCAWVQRQSSFDSHKDWYYSKFHRGKPAHDNADDDEDDNDDKRRNRKWFLSINEDTSMAVAYKAKKRRAGTHFVDFKVPSRSNSGQRLDETTESNFGGIFGMRPSSQPNQSQASKINCDLSDPLLRFRVGCQRTMAVVPQDSSLFSPSDTDSPRRASPARAGRFNFRVFSRPRSARKDARRHRGHRTRQRPAKKQRSVIRIFGTRR